MRARGGDQEEDSSGEGESEEHDEHSALQTIAEACDSRAHAHLRYVDELLSGKIRDFRKVEPQKIVSRHKLDVKMHCKVPFGAYCEVHVDPDITNIMEPRTKWGICLGPTGNMQGSYKFLSLSTGKKVTRRKFTEMPMSDSVIKMVDSLGKGTMQKWAVLQKQEGRRIHIQQ